MWRAGERRDSGRFSGAQSGMSAAGAAAGVGRACAGGPGAAQVRHQDTRPRTVRLPHPPLLPLRRPGAPPPHTALRLPLIYLNSLAISLRSDVRVLWLPEAVCESAISAGRGGDGWGRRDAQGAGRGDMDQLSPVSGPSRGVAIRGAPPVPGGQFRSQSLDIPRMEPGSAAARRLTLLRCRAGLAVECSQCRGAD